MAEQSRGRELGARAAWTFLDQAVSSLTTAVLTILVARTVSQSEFGGFSAAFLVFSFVIGVSRATITDPLVIRFGAAEAAEHREASRRAVAAAVLVGLICSVPTLIAGLAFGTSDHLGQALITLGVITPGMLLQDAWRYAFFSSGRAAHAAINDLLWAVLQFGSIAVLFATDQVNVITLMLSWGLAGLTAGLVGGYQAKAWPNPQGALSWVTSNRSLSWRLGADFIINMGSYNLANLAIVPVASILAVGALNAARTLVGPLNLFFTGTTSFVLPVLVRIATRGRLHRAVAATSAASAFVTISWATVLFLMPSSWGVWLLGDSWAGAKSVILPVVVGATAVAIVMGPALGLKCRAEGGRLLRTTFIQAPLLILLGILGAAWHGAVGAAWGFASAQVIGCGLLWGHFLASERHHAHDAQLANQPDADLPPPAPTSSIPPGLA